METKLSEKYVTNANGRKVSVILSYKRYQKLLEDIHDLAIIAERRDERSIPLSEFKKNLKKNGNV